MRIEISEDNLDLLTRPGNEKPLRDFMASKLESYRITQSFLASPISKMDVKMIDGTLTGKLKESGE